ncbi:MAG: thymidylate kinase [Acidobacteria bacterium]|nr:MAG: thymidylate kinase [Acidobacteriota bacterium]
MRESGLQVPLFTFWDDVVALARSREHARLKAFKGDKGVGSPDNPIMRRDKNVRSWYLTAFRLLLYLFDAVSLCSVVARSADSGVDFIVFDRYIYDELANLPLQNRMIRFYVRLLLMFIPKPDLAFLLDADPEAATLRKPEYPLEFVRHNREAYLRLSRLVSMTVVPPLPVAEATEFIRNAVAQDSLNTEIDLRLQYPLAAGPAQSADGENVPTRC